MKIVDRKTFLSLPENTLFSKYRPCIFDDLSIKMKSYENDFIYQDILDAVECDDSGKFAKILFQAAEKGTSFDMDFNCVSRDGMYDEGQLFAVWERKDVEALIERLKECLK